MKRKLIASLGLLLLVGCGSTADQACSRAGYDPQDVDLVVEVIRYTAAQGVPYSEAVAIAYDSAYTYEELDCFLAVIDEVY